MEYDDDQLQQQLQQLEAMVRQKLTREALQRYGNIKAAHKEKAVQLLVVLGQLIQSGNIDVIDDEKLKEILQKMAPDRKGTTIRRL